MKIRKIVQSPFQSDIDEIYCALEDAQRDMDQDIFLQSARTIHEPVTAIDLTSLEATIDALVSIPITFD